MEAKKSNHRANVVRITEILPHNNADTLEIIPIPPALAYQVVVKKGQFKVGDLAVYIQPDSVVPQTEPFKFIWGPYSEEHTVTPELRSRVEASGQDLPARTAKLVLQVPERRRRITVRKFRKEWSEGLLLPVTDFPEVAIHFADSQRDGFANVPVGEDVADLLGITHYDPDKGRESTTGDNMPGPSSSRYPKTLKGWYYFILRKLGFRSKNNQTMALETGVEVPVYDVEALKNYANAFEPGEDVIVAEKIHGSNARFLYLNGKQYAGSRTLWKAPNANCVWRKALQQNPWIEEWCRANEGYTLYGEVTPTQKGFDYGCNEGEVRFFAFDIRTPQGTWMKPYGIPTIKSAAPVLYTGPFDLETIKCVVNGPSTVSDAKHIREGVVISPLIEREVRGLGRLQLKLVSNAFLEKDSK
jgi:hypothetical protein